MAGIRSTVVTLLAALSVAGRVTAAELPAPFFTATDPREDANGPGTYQLPTGGDFQDGDFDLYEFAVRIVGENVQFEITLGRTPRAPALNQRTNFTPIPLNNGIYLQNVDIYVDSDPDPSQGFDTCIPGRRVSFADGSRWETAVVLTPQPGLAQNVVAESMGAAANHVVFAKPVHVVGRVLVATVPVAALGGAPQKGWGYSVHVSGAVWERTFSTVGYLRGLNESNAYTLPVLALAENWAFGGGPVGVVHPQVVDVLLPKGAMQAAVLSSFDENARKFAAIPFVYDGYRPTAPLKETAKVAPTPATDTPVQVPVAAVPAPLVVVDVAADMVSVRGPTEGLSTMQFGTVETAAGQRLGRVVVVRLIDGGLLANVVEGRENIRPGAHVRFGAP